MVCSFRLHYRLHPGKDLDKAFVAAQVDNSFALNGFCQHFATACSHGCLYRSYQREKSFKSHEVDKI